MSWQIALGILVIINTCSIILTKVAADKLSKRSVGIFYQYLICAILAILYAVFSGRLDISSVPVFIGISAVGFINAFGNYFQWQASNLSLSRTSLFLPLMEVVTILLAVIFLQEAVLWNAKLVLGATLCFLAIFLFRWQPSDKILKNKWFLFIIGMVLILGIAGFLLKVFSFTVSSETFLVAWYVGALIGSLPILGLEKQNPLKADAKTLLTVLPVSIAILGSLFALYWTYQLGGPVSLVLPIRGLAITIIPILVGWFVFKERKGFTKTEWLAFSLGIAGAVMVLLR